VIWDAKAQKSSETDGKTLKYKGNAPEKAPKKCCVKISAKGAENSSAPAAVR
jgi:hypothetical protein